MVKVLLCNRPGLARAKKAIVILLSLFFVVACSQQRDEDPNFKLSGETMGTTYHITVLNNGEAKADKEVIQQAVDKQLQQVNQQMSTYIPDSELSQLSSAPVDKAIKVSPDLFDVLMLSLQVSWLSNGAFDITVGPLVDLWGFGPGGAEHEDKVPTPEQIAEARKNVGYDALELDMVGHTVTKHRNVTLDLSGVAKGFGVDKVAELLDYAGFTDYMVEIGGELRLKGHNPRGEPWRIAIEEPDPGSIHVVHQALNISNEAMATSGDYRNYFEKNGRRYSHTIDPSTGYPIQHKLASVTVIAKNCAEADALATALDVLGPEKGMKLAKQQNLPVYMIVKRDKGFESIYSDAFKPYLSKKN